MVQATRHGNQGLYQCEECGFRYAEKEWAERCEAWCREHKSCNLEIVQRAVHDDTPAGESTSKES